MVQTASATMESVKEQVIDNVPKRMKELKFGIPYVDLVSAAAVGSHG